MSELYMLDTDTLVFVLRRSSETLLARIQAVPLAQQVMSAVTCVELVYGAHVSSKKKANQAAVDELARYLAVLDWPGNAASDYAEIRADLTKRGALIGANDLLIAAHARHIGATVVTNNTKHFSRVKGLRIANWLV